MMYEEGSGVPADIEVAAQWYLKAAELRGADSQARIAYMYLEGLGVSQNDSEAFKWFRGSKHCQSQSVMK